MSEIKTDKLTGVGTAGSIVVTGEGNSTTTNLQQGLLKAWVRIDGDASGASIDDSFNCASITDNGTGDYSVTRTNNMSSVDTYYVVDGQFVNSQNTNGVGIHTVGFNTITKDASVTLSVGYSTAGSFPFEVGDKVLIENIIITPIKTPEILKKISLTSIIPNIDKKLKIIKEKTIPKRM